MESDMSDALHFQSRLFRGSFRTDTLPGLLLLVLAATLLAGVAPAATDKENRPPDPDFMPGRQVFDCTARDTLELWAGFAAMVADSTTASTNELSSYACRQWNERGPENIYRLELTQDLELFAALRSFGDLQEYPLVDLDIFLLSDCDTDSCLAGANLEFSLALQAGTYYLVVDGFGNNEVNQGCFSLVLECRELGVPLAACAEGTLNAINPGTETLSLETNLFDQPNLVQTFSCSSIVERGGEVWYAVTLDGFHEFTVTLTSQATTVDAAFWLFDGCSPEAECLDFADDKLAGESETLSWANEGEEAITVYLACDSYREVSSEDEGPITLEFQGVSNVPTSSTSLGSFRSLYR